MNDILYYILSAVIVLGVLASLKMMSAPKTAAAGNLVGAASVLFAVILTLVEFELLSFWGLWISLAAGTVLGLIGAYRVKMIQMPQMVSLLNGLGGGATGIVAFIILVTNAPELTVFEAMASMLSLVIGSLTFFGSMVASGKLMGKLPQKPVSINNLITNLLIAAMLCITVYAGIFGLPLWIVILGLLVSAAYGIVFALKVGGADMPITIALLNSLTGVAGAAAGLSIGNLLLVTVFGVVGASGLVLTQIMCAAMNRKLSDILSGRTSAAGKKTSESPKEAAPAAEEVVNSPETDNEPAQEAVSYKNLLKTANRVIIVPGYGMALGQAQTHVKRLADMLEKRGVEVVFAIHPVAGRMPGHMNVLLAEVDVPYEKLLEMDEVNPMFENADVAIVIGANDVVNPAAVTAVDTPIYGLPILNVERAKHIIICNFNDKPGYAGVPNPLYTKKSGVTLMWGGAAESLEKIMSEL